MATTPDSFTFTVGKLDAGMAILLGERAHLIEFPSLLLPPGATTGSIVNIAVNRNFAEEKRREAEFWDLQRNIYDTFGVDAPKPPVLQLRNVTQTSVTLEWPLIHVATAKVRSLDIYRNKQRLATIPQPLQNTSTKLSGLEIDSEYTFQLVLRTTAGTFPSNLIRVRTHTMTDTSGISVCFGTVQDEDMLENAKLALQEMKATWSDKIQIDTTHFVCTTPAATPNGAQATGGVVGGPGIEYQRALQLSIPVVQPAWILACHDQRKMVAIAPFYLGVETASPPFTRPQSMSQVPLHRPSTHGSQSPTTPSTASKASRQSMPPPSRSTASIPAKPRTPVPAPVPEDDDDAEADTSTFVNQAAISSSTTKIPVEKGGEEDAEVSEDEEARQERLKAQRHSKVGRSRNGTMDRAFKFPPPGSSSTSSGSQAGSQGENNLNAGSPTANATNGVPTPTISVTEPEEETKAKEEAKPAEEDHTVEIPPPPPVEKERVVRLDSLENEDVGPTVEIDLN